MENNIFDALDDTFWEEEIKKYHGEQQGPTAGGYDSYREAMDANTWLFGYHAQLYLASKLKCDVKDLPHNWGWVRGSDDPICIAIAKRVKGGSDG